MTTQCLRVDVVLLAEQDDDGVLTVYVGTDDEVLAEAFTPTSDEAEWARPRTTTSSTSWR
ncbi:hypothetical protein [Microbispora sp. CA-102843]|uniref:hypothetical protein n=1 Tax=Microbispora sp. CA-102843 TaxID=3239952 RepID=UPI003D8BE8FE